MPCYRPLEAWYSKNINESGKRSLVFKKLEALQPDDPLQLPCGRCVGCRLERARQWAVRCMHESQMHDDCCFITLTFDNEHLFARSNPGSLDKKEFQNFMKRLRFHFDKESRKVRFYACGEYGEESQRPHYHALLFGVNFADRELFSERDGIRYYISQTLSALWPFGHVIIGDLTFDSACYVARYCMKKITGDDAKDHYTWVDEETGELRERIPEFALMSLKPAIGKPWFDRYYRDVYPNGFVVCNGSKMKPPKSYDRYLEREDAYLYDRVKENRFLRAMDEAVQAEQTDARLRVKEECAKARLSNLKRNI